MSEVEIMSGEASVNEIISGLEFCCTAYVPDDCKNCPGREICEDNLSGSDGSVYVPKDMLDKAMKALREMRRELMRVYNRNYGRYLVRVGDHYLKQYKAGASKWTTDRNKASAFASADMAKAFADLVPYDAEVYKWDD